MRIAYCDPPYPGYAHYYEEQTEVDHAALVADLSANYDGFVLHTHVNALRLLLPLCPEDVRIMSWVKPFAAFKANVSVAYAWEPVLVRACRKPVVAKRVVMRDFISCGITLQRGMVGVKPDNVVLWAFEMVGATLDDEMIDLYPGQGTVERCWRQWKEMQQSSPQTVDFFA
jgi:hypothetical protein